MSGSPPPVTPASSGHVQISIRADPSISIAGPSSSPPIRQHSWTQPSAPSISLSLRHSSMSSPQPDPPPAAEDSEDPPASPSTWLASGWESLGTLGTRLGVTPAGARRLALSRTSTAPTAGPSTALVARRLSQLPPPQQPWTTERVIDLASTAFSALWVLEPETSAERWHSYPHDSARSRSPARPVSGRFSVNHPKKLLQLSRFGYLTVLLLFTLGVWETISLTRHSRTAPIKIRVKGRSPFDVLASVAGKASHPVGALAPQERLWVTGIDTAAKLLDEVEGDVTGIVLHWKRTENVVVIVASLCQYSFFRNILVWNNNPDIHLTREDFAAANCPWQRLRIYNSPRNMFFLGRYLACSTASTPNCFFQDDDWLVQPIRALYSQFSRDSEGPVVVHTNPQVALLYSLEWCFFQTPLHTCFSWVGTGAFVAKSHVQRFLSTISDIGYNREELGHADNSFTLFQNEPPYVLSSELTQLPSPYGHSDGGEGISRNKRYIQNGLVHLTKYLAVASGVNLSTSALPLSPLSIDTTPYDSPSIPPLPPHPYAHHARSPCADDACVFLTNIALLPPPDAAPYPGPAQVDLEQWENHLGTVARGWIEGGELFAEEEAWAGRWPYAAAVDGRWDTAFRSPDVVKTDDYIAIGLLAAIDPQWIPKLSFHLILENSPSLLPLLVLEISTDGYHWAPPHTSPSPTCHATPHRSTSPDLSFPHSYLSSPLASAVRSGEQHAEEISWKVTTWWRRRRRRGKRLVECMWDVGTQVGERGGVGVGWRFVRVRSRKGGEGVGWGVYQVWLE